MHSVKTNSDMLLVLFPFLKNGGEGRGGWALIDIKILGVFAGNF